MKSRKATAPNNYDESVFINCPFDDSYKHIFEAILFCVYSCGFEPRCAFEQDNALDNRLDKIEKLIEECRYGIHDISRIELNENGLPRFNMPFELGIFFGARRFGSKTQKKKNALVLEAKKYLYQQYISDLNGVDTKSHQNNPETAIAKVRDWLQVATNQQDLPGAKIIVQQYQQFRKLLPEVLKLKQIGMHEYSYNDLCFAIEEAIRYGSETD
jgi:hypothetical protein